ncbi:spondin domain-containing protein [Parvularcula sp. LCG005]|uniref:spondin domain-containing protein n=1 Tax=Parvularcula sp. LCG005 TaxID=3078805 RepID=UPI002943C527|nr:spondin domain-containing protein [Parvularcula sp. LCG005]WOI52764.1 spondin domain-containing protein [Parvularcula sp. LCG005]
MTHRSILSALGAVAAGLGLCASTAHALPVTISITNNSEAGGLNLTPLFIAFHNGAYDAFDVGAGASAGVELIAETGDASGAMAEALGADANALTGVITAPGGFAGAPIIEPGESASFTFDVNPMTQRFLSYLSMVIPSNDTFIGNGSALEVFNAAGAYLGDRTLIIDGNAIWDAGTEANDLNDGAAFVVGQDAAGGIETMDPVALSNGIAAMAVALPTGDLMSPALANFFSDRSAFRLATISISADPVPVPAALPLFAAALGGGAFFRKRLKKSV